MKRRRELGPLGDAKVLPFRELLLERQQLLRGERCPRLPVRLVFPQVALDLGRFSVLCNRNEERVPLEDHRCRLPSASKSRGCNRAAPWIQGRAEGAGKSEPWPTATSCFCPIHRDTTQENERDFFYRVNS